MTVHVDAHNLIASVEGGVTLTALSRTLARQGFVLPIARPLPRMTLARACVALPYLVDALVQQASGALVGGGVFETTAAPRAAVGPSLVHALSTRPPLLTLGRARLRVGSRALTRVHVAELKDAREAARLVAEVADEGRALAVEASGARVVALVGAGTRSRMSRFDTAPAFAHVRGAFLSSTRSVGAADVLAFEAALARGERVLCAPFIGRAAVGLRARVAHAPASLDAALDAMTRALTGTRAGAAAATEAM